jgi:beta-phosphoglucomutase
VRISLISHISRLTSHISILSPVSNISHLLSRNQAFIFDLDGVLVDTAVFHYRAWKRLANSLGFDFSEQQNERLKGISRMQSLAYILEWGGVQVAEEERLVLAARKNGWYLEMVDSMTAGDTLPGAVDFLAYAREAGKRIALGSASKNAELILERTGIVSYFDVIVDGNSVTESKPDPAVFLRAAAALQCSPAESLVFEDAQAGVQAARAAGMDVIGIGRQHDLADADLVVTDLGVLRRMLDE